MGVMSWVKELDGIPPRKPCKMNANLSKLGNRMVVFKVFSSEFQSSSEYLPFSRETKYGCSTYLLLVNTRVSRKDKRFPLVRSFV